MLGKLNDRRALSSPLPSAKNPVPGTKVTPVRSQSASRAAAPSWRGSSSHRKYPPSGAHRQRRSHPGHRPAARPVHRGAAGATRGSGSSWGGKEACGEELVNFSLRPQWRRHVSIERRSLNARGQVLGKHSVPHPQARRDHLREGRGKHGQPSGAPGLKQAPERGWRRAVEPQQAVRVVFDQQRGRDGQPGPPAAAVRLPRVSFPSGCERWA